MSPFVGYITVRLSHQPRTEDPNLENNLTTFQNC